MIGATGPQGVIGPTGATGATGLTGPVSPANVSAIRSASERPMQNRMPSAASNYSPGYIDYTTGNYTAYSGYIATPYLIANAGGQMVMNAAPKGSGVNGMAFYDVNKTYISGIAAASLAAGTPFNVPATAAFLRVSFSSGGSSTVGFAGVLMIVDGATLPATFITFEHYAQSETDAAITNGVVRSATMLERYVAATGPAQFNMFDQTKITSGYYVNSTTGALVAYGAAYATDYMFCAGQSFVVASWIMPWSAGFGGAFYDDQHNFISSAISATTAAGTPIAVPANAVYVRFTFLNSGNAGGASAADPTKLVIVYGSTLPAGYVYPLNNIYNQVASFQPWSGKKFYVFGDSISVAFGTQWQNIVTSMTGAVLGTNDSEGGRSLYQAFTSYSDGTTVNTTALATALSTHDFIVLYLSTNDLRGNQGNWISLGTPTDTPSVPAWVQNGTNPPTPYPYSYCSYAQGVIDTIQNAAPTKRLIVVGMYHLQPITGQALPSGDYVWPSNMTNAVIDTFNSALKTICQNRGLTFIDLASTSGINMITLANPDGTPLYLRDHLHPSDTLGYPAVGHQIAKAITGAY